MFGTRQAWWLASIGLAFAAQPVLAGGRALAGGLLIAGCAVAWWKAGPASEDRKAGGRALAAAAGLAFLVALAVRVPRLDSVPPVLWDEGIQMYDARCVAAGLPVESLGEIRYHRSPAWSRVLAGWGRIAGWEFFRVRFISAVIGSLAVAVTAVVAIRLLGWTGGIFAVVWLVAHPWPVQLSRIMLANGTVPLAGAGIVALAVFQPFSLPVTAGLAGLVAGISVWGYAAAVHLPVLAAFGIVVLAPARTAWRRRLAAGVIALMVAVLTSAPAFVHGQSWAKARSLSLLDSPGSIVRNLGLAARMFHIEGDPDLRHQYPGSAPVGSPLTGPLLTLGLALILGARDRRSLLLAGWLLLALSPGLVSEGGARDGFRQAGAVPAFACLIGLGASALPAAVGARAGAVLAVALIGGSAVRDLRGYFVSFPADPAVRVWYRDWAAAAGHDLAAAATSRPISVYGDLPLSRHGIERAALFDLERSGGISYSAGGSPSSGVRTEYRDPWGEPQAVLIVAGSKIRYLTVLDVSADADELIHAGRTAGAEALVSSALRVMPDSALLRERLGFARLASGNLAGAAASFRTAVRLRPRLGASWDGLGAALFRMGRLTQAEAAVLEALRCVPDEPEFKADLLRIRAAMAGRMKS